MSSREAVAWVLRVCTALRLSQAKTLADLVAAALHTGRASLAALGRQLTGPTAAKHRIKRAWRFCANQRVVASDAMAGPIRRLCKRRKKPLLVALDWTEVRNFHTLMAAAVLKGRAVPLLWASYPEWELHKSQNNLEEGLLRLLRTLIPERVPVVLLADRGFGRTELARLCQHLGLRYLIRIKPDVWVEHPRFTGKLLDYPVKKGVRRLLKGVRYRKDDPVVHNVVVRWKEGLPKRRDEPWFLMTDLGASAVRLTELYGQRMTVEELFRDSKGHKGGFGLRDTQVTKADRLDRLLLVLALAYWLLVGLGLVARQRYRPGRWCSTNREKGGQGQCSAFTVGRAMLDRMRVKPDQAVGAVVAATREAVPKWG
jgi:Transposase DDE domain